MIRKKSRRWLKPTARDIAQAHNKAASLAHFLRILTGVVDEMERELEAFHLNEKIRKEKENDL